MHDACDWAARAVADVRGGASDRARHGNAAEKRHGEIGHTLRYKLGVRIVPVSGQLVGDDRGEQTLDGRENRDCERGRQERQDKVGAERGYRDVRQTGGKTAESRCDRFDGR